MDSRGIIALAALVLCVYIVFTTVKQYNKLSAFPGPRSAAFSRWWMIRATAAGNLYQNLLEVSQKYGHLVRIGPNDLVTDDPSLLRELNGLRSPFRRSDWYTSMAFDFETSHVLCILDDKLHAERRTKLIPGYSGREVEGLEQAIDARIEELCTLIETKYLSQSNTRPVDLARLCSFYTLDVIYSLALGEPMGFLKHDRDVSGYLANQKAMLPIFEWLGTWPELQKILRIPAIAKNVIPKKTDKTGVGLLLAFADRAVKQRRAKKHRDMLGSFLEHGLNDAEAEQEAVIQIMAGSDTTATTLRMGLFFMMTNPRVWQRLSEELKQVETSPISDKEAQRLEYLQACLKESLRIWPPVSGMTGKVVPEGGAHLLGQFVPGGTCINTSVWAVQRNTAIYGSDVEAFRPERWLPGGSPGLNIDEMNATVDLVFSYGKMACLGKPIGMIELRKTFAELVRRYEMSIVAPDKPMDSVNRNGLFIQENLWVRIEKRQ
jgi:cytochrome P450